VVSVFYPGRIMASHCMRINISKALEPEAPLHHPRRRSNRMPRVLALKTSVAWVQAAREARKAVEVLPRRRVGSTVLARPGSRKALERKRRAVVRGRLSKLKGVRRATSGTHRLRRTPRFTRLMVLPRHSKVDSSTGSERARHIRLICEVEIRACSNRRDRYPYRHSVAHSPLLVFFFFECV
jgi:hypothetical protein